MAGLITIPQLEAILGYDISSDDEVRIQTFIDLISTFIESYTGVSFTEHTDAVIVARADGKGVVEVEVLNSISKVERLNAWTGVYGNIAQAVYGYGYAFDGISMIYGLCPYETYRVTCDYGMTSVPEDIQNIVKLLVMAGSGLDATAVNGLKSYRVGDVEEAYGVSIAENGTSPVTLSRMMTKILNSYSAGTTTYRI